jgi:hypothetical protein
MNVLNYCGTLFEGADMKPDDLRDTWLMFKREHDNCSVDELVCDPKLRTNFLESLRSIDASISEYDALKSLMRMRKRKQLSN